MKNRRLSSAARVVLFYMLFAGLWVLISDRLLGFTIRDPSLLSHFQTYKGWGFVAISGGILYLLLSSEFERRAHSEQRHRETELRYQLLVERAADGILIVDNNRKVRQVNPSACHMFGYERDELIDMPIQELILPDEQGELPLFDADLLQGKAILVEQSARRKDGELLTLEISARMIENGFLQTIIRDIGERKQTEQALSVWAEIFQNTYTGVAVLSAPGHRLQLVNRALAEMHGYRPQELVGQDLTSLFVPTERDQVEQRLRVLERRNHHVFEAFSRRQDGSTLPVLVDVTAVIDDDGHLLYHIASVQDISERKQAEAKIQRQMQRLAALRLVDIAITSALDQRVVFNVLLDQVIGQLGVDAAAILISRPKLRRVEYAAGRGFRTNRIQETSLAYGEGLAGRVVNEARRLSFPNLEDVGAQFTRGDMLDLEGFQAYVGLPLVARGEVKGVLEVFQRSSFIADADWYEYLEAMASQAAIAIDNALLYERLQHSSQQLAEAYDATLEGWSRALELRDEETRGHSQRVTELTLKLAEVMGVEDDELVNIRRGTLLHDIGKMGVPDQILLKPGPLTPDEWELMRQHPTYAFKMLSPIAFLRPALDIPYCHHERWDGSGYPRGLKGEEIPLAARIFAVIDVWDALRSDRSYRSAWPVDRVEDYIRSHAGTHFDPQVMVAFLKMMSEIDPEPVSAASHPE